MADVYKFKVVLQDVSNQIWRDIEITSVSSVAKLGYTVLSAFETRRAISLTYDLTVSDMKLCLKTISDLNL